MVRRRHTANCAHCRRHFTKCRYNPRQKFCTVEVCKVERRRERQRKAYRKKYRHDDGFRETEVVRCRAGLTRRRVQRKKAVASAASSPATLDMELVTTGLLAQMIDSSDPQEVREAACALEQRGHRLAVGAHLARASPG